MAQPALVTHRPRTPRGQRTRQLLLESAEKVFGEAGFERASVADITADAGVALGTFYVYFPTKESIFTELIDELAQQLRRAIGARVAPLEGRLEVEREGFLAFFEFCAQRPNLYRIVRQAEFVDEAAYRRYYKTLGSSYAAGLKRAMARGEVRAADPEVLAYALMGIADFLGMRFVLWGKAKAFEGLADEVTQLLMHGLGAGRVMTRSKRRTQA